MPSKVHHSGLADNARPDLTVGRGIRSSFLNGPFTSPACLVLSEERQIILPDFSFHESLLPDSSEVSGEGQVIWLPGWLAGRSRSPAYQVGEEVEGSVAHRSSLPSPSVDRQTPMKALPFRVLRTWSVMKRTKNISFFRLKSGW